MTIDVSADPVPTSLRIDGVDHLAHVTWRPRETCEFYTGALGLPLVHAITAAGWVPEGQPDFVHFFFGLGKGNHLAFFFYFGLAPDTAPDDLMRRARHIAFHVETEDELHAWRARLKDHGVRVTRPLTHELIESIYFDDPNGIQLEITRPLRPFGPIDARDAELTVQALCDVVGATAGPGAPAAGAEALWTRKAELLRKRAGEAVL